MGPGREYRSVLAPGWESAEFLVSEARLRELGLPWADAQPDAFAPERCVFPLAYPLVGQLRSLGNRLSPSPGRSHADAPGSRVGERSDGAAVAQLVLSWALPSLLRVTQPLTGSPADRGLPTGLRRFALAQTAIRAAESVRGGRTAVAQLADTLRVSRRTLEHAFREAVGCSPAQYFRMHRLSRVRTGLVRGQTVTDAALSQQFVSLGRFSGQYRSQFGELPSQTRLRTARSGRQGGALEDPLASRE
jgi:AraC-like DNA-binding protein